MKNKSGNLSKGEFRKKFDRLVNVMWMLQRRIGELDEFERQWAAIFNRLKERTGRECKVKVLNWDIFHSFRWDKYHVLISDLLSALENEFDNEHSVCRQSIHHLRLNSLEHYIDREQKVNFCYDPDFPISEEDQRRHEREIQESSGARLRGHCADSMQAIFPNIGEGTQPSLSDVSDLTDRLRTLSKKIYSARQVFAHKHQEIVVRKHTVGMDGANIDQIKSFATEFFEIVRHIGLIKHHCSYADHTPNQERSIQDQIDLILFGSISSIHLRFYEEAAQGDRYRDARLKYYDSEDFLSIVAE